MFILVLVLAIVLLHWIFKTRREPGEPPILPGSLPLIGHGYMLLGDTVLLTDPEDICLVSNVCVAKDTVVGALIRSLLGSGLVFADVPTWKKHRKLIMPSFNQQILDGFIPIFNNQAKRLMKKLESEEDDKCFDPTPYVNQIILESICLTTMDVKLEEADSVKFLEAYDQAISNGIATYCKFWLRCDLLYNMTDMKIKQENCIRIVHETSDLVLQKKRMKNKRNRAKINSVDNNIEADIKKDTAKCFADLLLESNVLTEQELRHEVNGMIIAGSDTTSTVLVFALLLIGSYPEVQEKIYSELTEVFEGSNRDVQKQDLSRLEYLEAAIKETLRYYVMAPFVIRHIDKEIKLKSCTLKPGNNCFFSLYGVHRHPMWGDDVEEFKPQRWLDSPSRLPANANAFMAFSVGKRNCIGRAYAMMTMKILLSHIFRQYRVLADHSNMKVKLNVIIKPCSGHLISLEKRNM
ncbi:cytochrome P450 4C1 isoform X2 [Bicyclus anynana]|uniref:Cytochrome P450 4C1 isoform X2 n=1 Tax=Bicyclus anynana TaxID=110368 RepID=A0ABM3M0X7_BICAN|nr:cytochrome P450 4C1 isoform X2 [Bicyclus anynana]